MRKPLLLFAIGLFFGAGIGFFVAASNEITLSGHDHGDPAHHAGHGVAASGHTIGETAHVHGLIDVSGESATPTIALRLHPDIGGAINLAIVTENFAFAPTAVNGAHVPGQGHAHIYLNGHKIARAYGHWFHLTDLPEEGGELRVTLNANSHEELANGNTPIAANVAVPER